MDVLIKRVEKWAKERELDKADPHKQMLKVVEETGEVAGALARNDMELLREEIGDSIVTLIILTMQLDMDIHECLSAAYDKIKNRKGKTINGIYVKEDDLQKERLFKCNYCDELVDRVRPSPFMADVGADMCKGCWDMTQETYKHSTGEYIPDFEDHPNIEKK